jgi:predicted aspartyl protease
MSSVLTLFARLSVLWLLVIGTAAAANAACRVDQVSAVPIKLVNGHPLVTVMVNDKPATFILDSGAERTLMGEDVVRQLDIARDTWVASTVRGVGGYEERPNALPRSMRLGDVTLRRRTVSGDTSVTVGPLPISTVGGQEIAGLLGRDFLSPFDLDIDLPQQRLTLYDVQGCSGQFLPWGMPYAAIPAVTPVGTALVVPVIIDGRPLRALVDTGATSSLIAAPGMYRLGLTPQMLASDAAGTGSGIGPAAVLMRRHRFAEIRVGPDTTRNLMLWVATVRVVPIVDMLLGEDWLSARRVWLSFATKQVFVPAGQNG